MHSLLCLLFFLPTVASNCYEFQIPSTDGTKCFTIFEGELTYDQAQTQCSQVNSGQTPLGGTAMAAVHNLTDNDVLLGIANGRSFWLGGTNKHSGNTWNWVDRSKFDFKNWAAGQPGKAKNRCLLVDGVTGLWKAVDCGTTAVFVCQSNSVIYAPDGPPSTSCPQKTVCREGFAYVATSAVFTSWDDAEKYCLAKYKGHLASIHDRETESALEEFYGGAEATQMYIGGRNITGTWTWSDGTSFDYSSWEFGSAEGKFDKGNCLALGFMYFYGDWYGFEYAPCNLRTTSSVAGTAGLCKYPFNG